VAEMIPELSRAARALLKWTLDDLAQQASLARSTVQKFESARGDESTIYYANARAIKRAFENHGIAFIGDETTMGVTVRRDVLSSAQGVE
jgi:transcriptional regulator with XRE-family HTH domain